jgi:hypothetical protein
MRRLATGIVLAVLALAAPRLAQADDEHWGFPDEIELDRQQSFTLLGVKYDCYFTVEEFGKEASFPSRVQGMKVKGLHNIASRADLVKALNEQLKDVEVYADPDLPAVIRLVTKGRDRLPNYELERKLSLSFSGTIAELLGAVHKAGMGVQQAGFPVAPGIRGLDGITKVKLEAKDLPVRRLLTDYVPLSDYHRLIWSARSYPKDGTYQTYVEFRGPWSPERALSVFKPDALAGDFAGGQESYQRSGVADQRERWTVDQAIDFIRSRLKKKQPHQVRWAMFYLGRDKAEKGIPVLLEHIDYCYTAGALVEESYPAVKALRQLGTPSTLPVLARLRGEDDPQRLRLLCHVLASVEGQKPAAKLIQRQLDSEQDAAVKKRLEAAAKQLAGSP